MTKYNVFFHLTLPAMLFACCNGFAQTQYPTIGLVTHDEILLHTSRTLFAKNNISEIYFTENIGPLPYPGQKSKITDTTFYGLTKEGLPRYQLIQLYETWPPADSNLHINDSGWRGYDTTFADPCSLLTLCELMKPGSYDSIKQNDKKTEVYQSYNYKQTKLINIYNQAGWLVEQRVRNSWPDGSTTYRAIYKYKSNGGLAEIQYWYIGKHREGKPTGDVFADFSFDLLWIQSLEYDRNGLLTSIACTSRKSAKDPFQPLYTAYYQYSNGLPRSIKYKNDDLSVFYSPLLIGYKKWLK